MKQNIIKEIIKNNLLFVSANVDQKDLYILKNNSTTPIFLDTSRFISWPGLLEKVNRYIIKLIKDKNITFDQIVGIPYGGLPFSYGVTHLLKCPGLTIRKEGFKDYSTVGELLGNFNQGDKVLIIEDATVTAKTVIEYVYKLKNQGLEVEDVITILDIEKAAKANLANLGVKLLALFTWRELYEAYLKEYPDRVSQEMRVFLNDFIG